MIIYLLEYLICRFFLYFECVLHPIKKRWVNIYMTGIQKKKPIYLVEKTCKRWRKLSLYNVTFSSRYTWQGYVKYMRMIHLVNE